jgi:predicted RNA-binding protein Jag
MVTEDHLSSTEMAIREAEDAVKKLKNGDETVELSPQSAYIRRLQHLIAERSAICSHSIGNEPKRRVRFTREKTD